MKKAFVDWYVNGLLRKADRRRYDVRKLQEEAHRQDAQVIHFIVYAEDMRYLKQYQANFQFWLRVKDGEVEKLPPNTPPNATIITDIPTLKGIAYGTYTQVFPDGRQKVHDNFGVFDAVRLGRMETQGDALLSNILLFERRVAPDLMKELRVEAPA